MTNSPNHDILALFVPQSLSHCTEIPSVLAVKTHVRNSLIIRCLYGNTKLLFFLIYFERSPMRTV